MSNAFLWFLLVLLVIRAIHYSTRYASSFSAYVVSASIEIAAFFALFAPDRAAALVVPGVVLLIDLFRWSFEIRVAATGEGERVPARLAGLILELAAFAVVFASAHAPELRSYLAPLAAAVTPRLLVALAGGIFVTFELGHLTRRPALAPARLVVYLFWLSGAFIAAAIAGAASLGVSVFAHDPSRRSSELTAGSVAFAGAREHRDRANHSVISALIRVR